MRAPLAPVAAYAVAATLAGALTGGAAAAVAILLRSLNVAELALLAAVLIAVTAVASEWRGTVRPLPERRAQVPRPWLLWPSRTRTAAAFGLIIGAGFLTFLEHAAVYVVLAALLLAPSLLTGVVIGGCYGAGRGAVLALTWVVDRRGHRLGWDRLLAHKARVHRAVAVVACATAVPLLILGANA